MSWLKDNWFKIGLSVVGTIFSKNVFYWYELESDQIWDVLSLLIAFAGTYLSLRNIFVSRIYDRISQKLYAYNDWKKVPIPERIVFRVFGITEKNKLAFFMTTYHEETVKLHKKLYGFWEPFRALLYFVIAIVIQIYLAI